MTNRDEVLPTIVPKTSVPKINSNNWRIRPKTVVGLSGYSPIRVIMAFSRTSHGERSPTMNTSSKINNPMITSNTDNPNPKNRDDPRQGLFCFRILNINLVLTNSVGIPGVANANAKSARVVEVTFPGDTGRDGEKQ